LPRNCLFGHGKQSEQTISVKYFAERAAIAAAMAGGDANVALNGTEQQLVRLLGISVGSFGRIMRAGARQQ
jgi:hypothetical protein